MSKKTFKEFINETSLSKIWVRNEQYDCAALTAFRKAEECGEGKTFTKNENKARNKSLLAKLKVLGYSVISLKGKYPEGGQETIEESFFVVDIENKGNLEKDVKKLGEEFDQDSILFIPKGSIQGTDKAYLIGTNKCPNNWLGYGKTEVFNKGKLGYDSEIYTSYVNGRPFIFEQVGSEIHNPGNGFGYISLQKASEKNWIELIEE